MLLLRVRHSSVVPHVCLGRLMAAADQQTGHQPAATDRNRCGRTPTMARHCTTASIAADRPARMAERGERTSDRQNGERLDDHSSSHSTSAADAVFVSAAASPAPPAAVDVTAHDSGVVEQSAMDDAGSAVSAIPSRPSDIGAPLTECERRRPGAVDAAAADPPTAESAESVEAESAAAAASSAQRERQPW